MKIAYIGQKGIPAIFGGVERYTEEVAVRMASKGHDVYVYVRNNYTPRDLKEYKGVKLVHLPSIATKNLDAITHTFLATIHALMQDYDIIHYHSIGPTSLSFIVRVFKPKTKIVATYQCKDYMHQKWGAIARLYLKFGEYMTCVVPHQTITVTVMLRDFIKKRFGKDVPVIPNGMAVLKTEKTDELEKWGLKSGQYIISVSRLIRHKGIHYLIEAFMSLEDKGLTKGKQLVIVGEGFHTDDYVAEIKKQAKGRAKVIFTGSQSGEALRQLFSHAYTFVQPSESEGLSLALLEALGYGNAVLSSDIVENKTVVEDVGLLFKNKNAKDLEEKLAILIEDETLAKRLGEKGREKAEKEYSWDMIADKIEQVYRKLLPII